MRVVCSPESKHSGLNCFVQQRPQVYIPCMSPRNYAGCIGILSGLFRALLAQFGLTPKLKRGLAASEAGKHTKPLAAL